MTVSALQRLGVRLDIILPWHVNPNIRVTAEEDLVSDWMIVESETL
jgi:hypothetical protein